MPTYIIAYAYVDMFEAAFDLAFECAGAEATISAALEHINKGGTIVQVALYAQPPRLGHDEVNRYLADGDAAFFQTLEARVDQLRATGASKID